MAVLSVIPNRRMSLRGSAGFRCLVEAAVLAQTDQGEPLGHVVAEQGLADGADPLHLAHVFSLGAKANLRYTSAVSPSDAELTRAPPGNALIATATTLLIP
ncbi:hypothetical protein OV450_6626 [Actinobacteria bacterium OV450]|nr:hypothetical protein OV450_6626 [Actinobacteria bacterium OV450]